MFLKLIGIKNKRSFSPLVVLESKTYFVLVEC